MHYGTPQQRLHLDDYCPMGFKSVAERLFSAASKPAEQKIEYETEKLTTMQEMCADPTNDVKVQKFVSAWEEEIQDSLVEMRRLWDEGRRKYPNLSVNDLWECWEARGKKILNEQMDPNSETDKFVLKMKNLVDRTAWSFLKTQIRQEAGVL